MTSLECSGLITLVKKYKNSKLKEKFITMPKGTDFATITNPELYSEYGLTRKALIVDVRSDLLVEAVPKKMRQWLKCTISKKSPILMQSC